MRLSFRATSNAAFTERLDRAVVLVKQGDELTAALTATGLFPEEFQHVLFVGEESGRLTEVLRQQADYYHDEAGRRMKALTAALAWLVWLIVAGFIITFIFRLALAYLGAINSALS